MGHIAVMAKEAKESAPSWMMGKSEASEKIEGVERENAGVI
jgi:hypothetical protein